MTEDEVALMVKNALRKARRAMSSPGNASDDSRSNDSLSKSDANEPEEDLARRIEEEIKGARAFAEKVYYGRPGGPQLKNAEGGATPAAAAENGETGKSRPPMSPSSFKGKQHGAAANATNAAATANSNAAANAAAVNSNIVSAASPTSVSLAASTSAGLDEENEPPLLQINQPAAAAAAAAVYAPNNNNSNQVFSNNTSPSHTKLNSPSTTNTPSSKKEQPRQHRQVVFRHPYPLPPPPILPRPDASIIAENDVRQTSSKFKIAEPDEDLSALIQAATDESLVRRSNAVGALKVLAGKDHNRLKMCRTRGLLDALLVACKDDAVDSDALDARTRAVTALLYLAEPKDNRLIVCRHENMLDTLIKIIKEDTGEARLRACCMLATLAKTPQNRGMICSIGELPGVLSGLMAENVVVEKEEGKKVDVNKTDDDIRKSDTAESRDDSTMRGNDDDEMSASYNSEDDRMLNNTYSSTFSNGTGTFTEDFSDEDDDDDDDDASHGSMSDDNDDGYSTGGDYSENESIQEEEGVEMQISSLKKLNIENHGDFLARSQLSACATLTHLTKHCANAPILAQDSQMLENIVVIASLFDNPLHTRCIEIICNLTRFPSNNARLASNSKVVDTLLQCGKSKTPEDRLWAIRTIQNLCSDAGSKVTLATGPILSMLSTSAMRKDYEEQYAAVGALMNLSTEPGSIVPLTNTKTVVATLVHLAHSPNTPAQVRKIACDSLATIGLWLQTLASAGTVPEEIPFSPLPTHSATGWLRWES